MKKLKNIFLCLIFALCMFLGCFSFSTNSASALNFKLSYETYSAEVQTILTNFCSFKTRIAGSDNEKEAANYIKDYILANSTLVTAKNNSSTVDGVQNFKFINNYTGVYNNSQNIIFEYKPATETKKKLIIACNYDAPLKYDEEKQEFVSFDNDAVNVSASGVACLLMLTRILPQYSPNFNIEFVFFGAGENSYAGSNFYLNGLSKDDAKNVLSVINIDKIGVGKNMYFYMDEIETNYSRYVSKVCSSFAKQVDLIHLNKAAYVETELNLNYSHIGLDSDNVKFMKRGIATINMFAGEYETGIIMGRNEHTGSNVVSYTENDNLDYIKTTFGENEITNNLYRATCAIESLVSDEKFEENASKSYQKTAWFYEIFANEELVVFVTTVTFIVMIIVAMMVYYKLTIKSYYADVEVEFLSSVVKIADQIDSEEKDKDVANVIGQVLANDIKKDKTLKPEKKKKDSDKK